MTMHCIFHHNASESEIMGRYPEPNPVNYLRLTMDIQIYREIKLYEPPHDKTNKVACSPSEDSDQPGHPPSLIRVFAVRMKKPWALSYPLSAQRRH